MMRCKAGLYWAVCFLCITVVQAIAVERVLIIPLPDTTAKGSHLKLVANRFKDNDITFSGYQEVFVDTTDLTSTEEGIAFKIISLPAYAKLETGTTGEFHLIFIKESDLEINTFYSGADDESILDRIPFDPYLLSPGTDLDQKGEIIEACSFRQFLARTGQSSETLPVMFMKFPVSSECCGLKTVEGWNQMVRTSFSTAGLNFCIPFEKPVQVSEAKETVVVPPPFQPPEVEQQKDDETKGPAKKKDVKETKPSERLSTSQKTRLRRKKAREAALAEQERKRQEAEQERNWQKEKTRVLKSSGSDKPPATLHEGKEKKKKSAGPLIEVVGSSTTGPVATLNTTLASEIGVPGACGTANDTEGGWIEVDRKGKPVKQTKTAGTTVRVPELPKGPRGKGPKGHQEQKEKIPQGSDALTRKDTRRPEKQWDDSPFSSAVKQPDERVTAGRGKETRGSGGQQQKRRTDGSHAAAKKDMHYSRGYRPTVPSRAGAHGRYLGGGISLLTQSDHFEYNGGDQKGSKGWVTQS